MRQPIGRTLLALLAGLQLAALAAAQDTAQSATTADLPVTRVVLFTSGVGYFEHSGTVTGTQEMDLSVAADQMDDLLQSLVVQDLDGGQIRPVRYPSRDPLERILAGYSLDLSNNPSLANLLAQARGEAVHVEAGQPLDGTIVNVESVQAPDAAPTTFVTLLTDQGLRRVALDEVRDVRFQSEALQGELEAALAAIARYRGADDKTVRLRFTGEGTRRVRVGYVREMPVWKTSYRLVLAADGQADLQGWAIVDNPTNLDLENVSMSFVAGRPISFITALYDPIYLPRPRVSLDLAQNLAPQAAAADEAPKTARAAAPAPSVAAESAADAVGFAQMAPAAPQLSGAGVEAMAQGTQTGATFEYRVQEPVTVGRHESAMIPIVLAQVDAPRLSIFDPRVLSGHPLRGVRLVNDTGLHLAAGPVTVFDAGGFTGDARFTDIVPGDSRVLTYAVDQGVEVDLSGSSEPEQVTAVTLRNGLLVATVRQRLRTAYHLSPRDGAARFVVLEQPKRAGYDVVSPATAPAETADSYRFGVAMEGDGGEAPATDPTVPTHVTCSADASCDLEVVLEHTEARSVAVSNVSSDDIAFYLENVELSDADRATLTQIVDLKRQLADLDRQIATRQARIDAIHQDQSRIRSNMSALDRNSSLYRRYVADLDSQENELDGLGNEIETLTQQRDTVQGRLDDLIASLAGAATP